MVGKGIPSFFGGSETRNATILTILVMMIHWYAVIRSGGGGMQWNCT
jgi:hypothetical protein